MIELRTPREIEQMRPAGRFVADVLTQVSAAAKVGINLLELDALAAGIAAAQPGNKIGDISAAIAAVGHGAGYRINTDFGGHGVGRTMHGDPHVPNDGRKGRGVPLKPGLVIAMVCSLCAVRQPVALRSVQPSSSMARSAVSDITHGSSASSRPGRSR